MRQVQLTEEDQQLSSLVSEVEAGQRLVLMRGGKAVAEIGPAANSAMTQLWSSEDHRRAAAAQFLAILDEGYDLGGFKIERRDDLYDRD